MKLTFLALVVIVLISGCQSEPASQDAEPKSGTTTANKTSEPTGQADSEIKQGMEMAAVKKLKGAPKDTKHEHGANGAEIDFWIYDDLTVKFENGKVIE